LQNLTSLDIISKTHFSGQFKSRSLMAFIHRRCLPQIFPNSLPYFRTL
jgi:hypothetical protein